MQLLEGRAQHGLRQLCRLQPRSCQEGGVEKPSVLSKVSADRRGSQREILELYISHLHKGAVHTSCSSECRQDGDI